MLRVTFKPSGEAGEFEAGLTILAAAEELGAGIAAPCGGKGRCGRCLVRVEGECSAPTEAERQYIGARELAAGYRLACEAALLGDAAVTVPLGSQTNGTQVLSDVSGRRITLEPNATQCGVQLPLPSLADQRSDCTRLGEEIGITCRELTAELGVLRALPGAVRAEDFHVNVVTVGTRLARVLPASSSARCLGVAVDIGTTTVVLHLMDLGSGQRLATASALNPQARYGHDLISRIEHSNASPGGLGDLQGAILRLINDLLLRATRDARVSADDVFEVAVVGNTAMHHMFLGLDPANLARAPYIPVTSKALEVPARQIGLAINPAGNVYCLPVIAGFVGADTVAVLTVSELTSRQRPTMAIDIGTNGEVMLWSGERLLVTSCAAGPAFEGAEISHGVRAASGAIEHVRLRDGDLEINTINGDRPNGICGSGIFDIVAVLLESGAADHMGRLAAETDGLAEGIASRLRGEGPGREFLLVPAGKTADDRDIVFTQKDLREVQLAKGAVRAAVELLCIEAGVRIADLDEVLLAGAFGNYIDPRSALRIGLLPPVALERIVGIGNAAGAGAVAALISTRERERAEELAGQAEHMELMARADFQMVYAESMLFPEQGEQVAVQ
ncbi:MAG TPA: ASKHA domain-containing protein [Armatimonadota bacterium]|nr:ASKHA domain-containing protein [Armatimonadota bacterium]